jgi:glycosyltransferase involved in cell wall biosynthesis
MISISLCMIVRNEEDTLARCLESVKAAVDEIIIVDTGSTDRTKEIAKDFTDKIYDYKWIDDFSAARNFSFSMATKDYIMWLDADDVLLKEDVEKLIELKETLDPITDSVTMKYNIAFDEYGNVTTTYRRNRLVKRERGFRWIGFVHEYLEVYGKIVNSDIAVTHKKGKTSSSNRNLEIYRSKLAEGVEFTPRDILYYANELYDHQFYEEALKYYKEFLDSKRGWVEDNIRVCRKIGDYYRSLGKEELVREYAYKTFEYALPRAEACCRLGFSFMQEKRYEEAAFWYELATKLVKPKDSWGFFEDSCWTWLPHLQLCVCYDRLGKKRLAFEHNEIAAKYRPNDERILYNRRYFKSIGIE